MSSRDHNHSGSHSRKRDRSVEGHSGRRSDKDRERNDKNRDHHSSHSSTHTHSSKKDDGSSKRRRDDDDREKDKDSGRDKKSSKMDKDDRSRSSKKSSKHDTDKERHHRSRRSDSRSVSGSGSESGSESGNDSEEDELVKKAKSLIQTISEDDYFTKSTEFRLWLRQAKKKYFEDLTADEARRYFKKFVRAWNDFDLDESYYKGIRSSQLSSRETTKYKWGFAKKIGKDDLNKVEAVRDSIDTMTNTRFAQEVSRITGKSTASSLDSTPGSGSAPRRALGPTLPSSATGMGSFRRPTTADEVAEREERDQRNRQQQRAENKAYRKTKEVVLDELVPKATGREAMLEKKRSQTAYHRRERSPDVELPEHDLMGTGDDFKSMLAAERQRNEAREARRGGGVGARGPSIGPSGPSQGPVVSSVKEAKHQAYKEKEEKQLEAFRQLWAQTQAAKGL